VGRENDSDWQQQERLPRFSCVSAFPFAAAAACAHPSDEELYKPVFRLFYPCQKIRKKTSFLILASKQAP
jgi:hypothetical protein